MRRGSQLWADIEHVARYNPWVAERVEEFKQSAAQYGRLSGKMQAVIDRTLREHPRPQARASRRNR